MRVRDLNEDDWKQIAWLASNEAQEGDQSPSSDWIARRKLPAERYQSVIDRDGRIEAYCSVERNDAGERFRAFLVLDWINLDEEVADFAFARLEELIDEAKTEQVWMREMVEDKKLLAFVQARGFVVERQYELGGHEMVNLVRPAGT